MNTAKRDSGNSTGLRRKPGCTYLLSEAGSSFYCWLRVDVMPCKLYKRAPHEGELQTDALVCSTLLPKTERIHSRTDEVVVMVCCSAVIASISCKSSIWEMERLKGRRRASSRKGIQGFILQGSSSSWYCDRRCSWFNDNILRLHIPRGLCS